MDVHEYDDLDTAPCGFLVFDNTGEIRKVNQTLVSMLGYTDKASLEGKTFETVLTVAGRLIYHTQFFPSVNLQGKADEFFFNLKGVDGLTLPVICNIVKKLRDDKPEYHCIFFPTIQRAKYEQDLLDAKKRAEDTLRDNEELIIAKKTLENNLLTLDQKISRLSQLNNELVQFGKLITHDLQEPIRKIAVFADKIAEENQQGLPSNTVAELKKINRECHRLRDISLSLEKFISLNLHRDPVILADMDTILNAAVKEAIANTGKKKISVTVAPIVEVEGVQNQLSLLFYHVLHNAIMYKHPDRDLRVSVDSVIIQQNSFKASEKHYRYEDFVQITIADNGQGFDTSYQQDLFSIGKKVEESGRLGLSFGLAFCKKIVDNHHGFITLQSKKDSGTTVKILLPVKQPVGDDI